MDRSRTRRRLLKWGSALALSTPWAASLSQAGSENKTGGNRMKSSTDRFSGLTATDVVRGIASGQLSAQAYMAHAAERAAEQRALNSFIAEDWQAALEAARKVDAQRRAGASLAPLAGLPISVKDNINIDGWITSGGTRALKAFRPAGDAPLAARLRAAGAIVVGKTNMHELAFGITNVNSDPFPGTARNPHDPSKITGGSSGGAAASVAGGIVPCALGTDTSGSIRIPASLCGIVGFRPTVGNGASDRRYDATGIIPISPSKDTAGPMANCVADVVLLDAVMTGSRPSARLALKDLRLATPPCLWTDLDDGVRFTMETAKRKLAEAGVVFVEVDMPELFELNDRVSAALALHEPIAAMPRYLMESGAEGITLASIAAQIANADVSGAWTAVLGDAFGSKYPDVMAVHRPRLVGHYREYFARHRVDAILFPATPVPAISIVSAQATHELSINGAKPVPIFNTYVRHTDPGASAGLPGLVLPAGRTREGLPVGLELDGPHGSDARLLAVGEAIEALLGRLPRLF